MAYSFSATGVILERYSFLPFSTVVLGLQGIGEMR